MGDVSATQVSPIVAHVAAASTQDGSGAESVTARHYGYPLVEQTRVDEGSAGLADGWDRVALLVTGEEARSWLNGFISQKVDAAQPGTATDGLLLDAQGRVEQEFGISVVDLDGSPAVLMDVAADHADALEDFLRRMVFWARVEISRPELTRLSLLGREADPDFPGPGHAGTTTPLAPSADFWRTRVTSGVPVTDLWVPRSELKPVWDALVETGARPTGGAAVDAWRLRDRRPVLGVDTDDRLIPHEVPAWIGAGIDGATRLADATEGPTGSAVHLNKGCYRGQETVSRVHNLGRPPRLLVLLQLDGSAGRLPDVGADVTAGGRTVGRMGTPVQDADYGPVALALVKRAVVEAVAEGTAPPLQVDGVDAAIDRDDLHVDKTVRPGRAAVNKLKGR
ncbi:MAG: folate-binding protein [Corynebacterium variabile]|uniref:CAF17-like 4Fe-4S cluster assembly/insertion protein YgfZ n=1 Tax=Corynebacterium variabile TaxID=1727 RepID=UPI002649FC8B|nr:folate-binding protein [Corynebacterium variabile]MDN6477874.1 folate-binding protein [Corynebacterium variabile]MDN6537706.1 folate-binding protein [Corynebacterium variabile]